MGVAVHEVDDVDAYFAIVDDLRQQQRRARRHAAYRLLAIDAFVLLVLAAGEVANAVAWHDAWFAWIGGLTGALLGASVAVLARVLYRLPR